MLFVPYAVHTDATIVMHKEFSIVLSRMMFLCVVLVGLVSCAAAPPAATMSTLMATPPPSAVPAPVITATSDAEDDSDTQATPEAEPAGDALDALSDEFDDSASLASWRDHAAIEGWPSWIEHVDVDTTSAGHLYLVPTTSGWFEDRRGVFLFKEVTGDFDVRTRIRTTGKNGDLPALSYSLSGLMARAPRDVTPDTWEPYQENWVFITTGYGDENPRLAGKPQIETKTTQDSRSTLTLSESRNDWVELRIVRVGPNFLMLYRFDGDNWTLSKRFLRKGLPATLQVGLNAYSSGGHGDADPLVFNRTDYEDGGDLVVRSDYVRFTRPQIAEAYQQKIAAGFLKTQEWVAAVGD